VLTSSRIALRVSASLALAATIGLALAAPAAAGQADTDGQLWVGSTDLDHVAGKIRPDAQLGLNFGITPADTAGDILLSVDLADVTDLVVVTGLTAGCDAAPSLITCQLSPTEAAATYQSMTLAAASGARAGSTGTITLSATFLGDASAADDNATIDVEVAPRSDPKNPAEPTNPAPDPTPKPAETTVPPVVIAPLPTVAPSQSTAEPIASAAPSSPPSNSGGMTFAPTLAKVPQAIGTRQPGFVQTGVDGNRYVAYAGAAPSGSATGSPVFAVAVAASAFGLVALLIFATIHARRANAAHAAHTGNATNTGSTSNASNASNASNESKTGNAGNRRSADNTGNSGRPEPRTRTRPRRPIEPDGPTERLPRR
jgi:hypothetical protein